MNKVRAMNPKLSRIYTAALSVKRDLGKAFDTVNAPGAYLITVPVQETDGRIIAEALAGTLQGDPDEYGQRKDIKIPPCSEPVQGFQCAKFAGGCVIRTTYADAGRALRYCESIIRALSDEEVVLRAIDTGRVEFPREDQDAVK